MPQARQLERRVRLLPTRRAAELGSEHSGEFGMDITGAQFEFLPATESVTVLRRTAAELKIAATEQKPEPPLRRRAVRPAQAAVELGCGALTEPRTTT